MTHELHGHANRRIAPCACGRVGAHRAMCVWCVRLCVRLLAAMTVERRTMEPNCATVRWVARRSRA